MRLSAKKIATLSTLSAWCITAPLAYAQTRSASQSKPEGDQGANETAGEVDTPEAEPTRVAPSPVAASVIASPPEWREIAPHTDTYETFRYVPSVLEGRPEGEAVAPRYRLRGFDAGFGKDLAVQINGISINQSSHVMGHGYADTAVVPQEVILEATSTGGPHGMGLGDFSTAGAVNLRLGVADRRLLKTFAYGSFNAYRQVLLWAPESEEDETFGAFVFQRSDGFGERRRQRLGQGVTQYKFSSGKLYGLVRAMFHASSAQTPGYLAKADIDAGRVSYLEAYQDEAAENQAGSAASMQLGSTVGVRENSGREYKIGGYVRFNRVRLEERVLSNTLVKKRNRAWTVGAQASYRTATARPTDWAEGYAAIAIDNRFDITSQGSTGFQSAVSSGDLETGDVGGYLHADWRFFDRIRVQGGIRLDVFFADFVQEEDGLSDVKEAWGPRGSMTIDLLPGLQHITALGFGYRSSHARSLAIRENLHVTSSRNLESGFVFTQADWLELRTVAFWNKLDSEIVLNPFTDQFESNGPSRRYGATLFASARPLSWIFVSAFFEGVRALQNFESSLIPRVPSPTHQRSGRVPLVPPWLSRFDLGFQEDLVSLNGHELQGELTSSLRVVGPRPTTLGETAAAFSTLDVRASLLWNVVEVQLELYNLLDTRYPTHEALFSSNAFADAASGRLPEYQIAAGPPRRFMATLNLRL